MMTKDYEIITRTSKGTIEWTVLKGGNLFRVFDDKDDAEDFVQELRAESRLSI